MLKSEHYGIHQIKVQNIICSRERGSPVLSGDTQRVARQIHTEYRIYSSEWDADHSNIICQLPSLHNVKPIFFP